MQAQTKQRLIGASVIVAIAAIFLPVLFYHPLPGLKTLNLSAEIPAAPNADNPQLVYDLSLHQGQLSLAKDKEVDQDELVPTRPLSLDELRSRAAETTVISRRMLHSAQVPATLQLNDTAKTTVAKVEHLTPVVQKEKSVVFQETKQGNNSARDLSKKKVSFQAVPNAIPQAWVLQLGSFTDKVNAMQLVNQLRQMKLDAYTRSEHQNGTKVVQVFVGPYIQIEAVEGLQKDLRLRLQLQGVIKKYTVS